MTDARRTDLLAIALLIATATVFFSDVLFAGSNFYNRDLFPYHFPMKALVRQAMLSGDFPFWNRFYSGGQPLAANPAYELFYPLQWLILVGSYPFGFALHIVSHVWIALAGMYLLLRAIRLGVPASLFGALSFGMGGLLLGSIPVLPTFFVWSLAPIVGWAILRFIDAPSASRFAVAALFAGIQLLIGEPMSLLQVWFLIGLGVLLRGHYDKKHLRPIVIMVAAIAAGAALIAAVQIVPALDHTADSVRARGIPFQTVRQFAMPPVRPFELFVPHLFGRFDPEARAFWGARAFDRLSPYLASIYCGVLVAVLAIAGLIARLRGAATASALAVLSYILAIGDHTPLLRLAYDWNVARIVRYPEKFAALGIVALVVFAAAVADRLLSGDENVRRAAAIAACIVSAVSALPLLWTFTPRYTESFLRFWGLPERRADMAALAASSWRTGFLIAVAAACLLLTFRRVSQRLWMLAALALVVFDLFVLGNDLVPRMPRSFFTAPAAAQGLDGDRGRYALFNRSPWMPYQLDFQKYEAVSRPWFQRNALQPFTQAAWGFRSNLELDFDETDLLPTHELLDSMMQLGNSGFPRWGEAFAAIANVRYIVDLRPFDEIARESGGDLAAATPVRFTRMPQSDRYYFPRNVVRVAGTADVLASMRRAIPISTAFVGAAAPPPPASSAVLQVTESGNAASIDVQTSGPALLVATVTRHKYWRATIDGRPAEILPANIAYQAVVVPAGRHRLEFRYANPLVVAGGLVSSLALAACAVAIALRRPRRRPRNGS